MSDGQPPLPPELNWENMEAGILQKMEELETGKPPRRPGAFKKAAAAVVLLAILILMVKYCGPTKGGMAYQNNAASQKQAVETTATPEMQQTATTTDVPSSTATEQEASATPAENIGQETAKSGFSAGGQNQTKTDQSTPIADFENTTNSPTRRVAASSVPAALPAQPLANGTKTTVAETLQLTADEAASHAATPATFSKTEASLERPLSEVAETLPSRTFFVEREKTAPGLPGLAAAEPSITPNNRDKGRIFLLGGVSAWGMGFGSNEPERKDFESTTVSFHTGLSYIHTLKNNLTLSIGMQVQQLHSRFEWNQEINNYKITLEDTVLQVQVNSLTGGAQELRGDVELEVAARRVIRHYNTIRLYQIPFAVGKTWSAGKWQADAMLGGAISIFSENKGRTLDRGEILDYEGSNNRIVSNKGTLNALLAGRLSYQLSRNMGITTGIQLQKGLSNWSPEPNIRMRPNILNLEIGLKYSL